MPAMPDHAETVAVISGGTQGLGLAIAERLIAEGCGRLVLSGRDARKGEAAAEALRATGADVAFVAADSTRVAFGDSCSPAPTSPSCGACSMISEEMPFAASESAVVRPATPAPTMVACMMDMK